jgi:hypothetical protein
VTVAGHAVTGVQPSGAIRIDPSVGAVMTSGAPASSIGVVPSALAS